MIRLVLLLLALFSTPAFALDNQYFAQIPIQHEGRIKPIDTFARALLNNISGRDALGGMDADTWLAETLFDPAQALQRPIFRILRPETLNLPARDKKYYSYAELAPALQNRSETIQKLLETDEKEWSEDQRELIRLHEASILYTQLLRSFSFLLPLNITPPDFLKITEEKPFTLKDYALYQKRINERLQKIIRAKGDDPEKYTHEEKHIAEFAFQMRILEQAGENNILFRVISQKEGVWKSAWEEQDNPAIDLWKSMAFAYLQQDKELWIKSSKEVFDESKNIADHGQLNLERIYNNFHPLTVSLFLYFLAFLGFAAHAMTDKNLVRIAALSFLGAGTLANIGAIILRVMILDRPPVGTLYESIIFVAALCALVSFFYEWKKKDGNGLMAGSLSGLLLLFVAQSFGGDDTMKMLVAVLNTNFWLATHVLCITAGYGWCILTSLLAHTWLARKALGKETNTLIAPTKTMALIALLFTAVGTILGGIWADQSWGRFWGWDPKENGALLIVLWLIWALHASISGHLKRTAYMAAMAALSVIVALAWFGVNLLGTGLHSYGFITGVAAALGAFCLFEATLIGGLWYRIHRTERSA